MSLVDDQIEEEDGPESKREDLLWHSSVLLVGGLFMIAAEFTSSPPAQRWVALAGGAYFMLCGVLLKRRYRYAKVMAIVAALLLAAWGLWRWIDVGFTIPRVGMLVGGIACAFIYASLDVSPERPHGQGSGRT